MNQDIRKQRAAEAALDLIEDGSVIGVGTGSTVNYFIEGLASLRGRIGGAVSSSEASAQRLRAHAIPVLDLNATGELPCTSMALTRRRAASLSSRAAVAR